jgi:protease-4
MMAVSEGSSHPDMRPALRRRGSIGAAVFRLMLIIVLACSLAVNVLIFLFLGSFVGGVISPGPMRGKDASLNERFHSGNKQALNKIAIVHIEGVILEGFTGYATKQILQAGLDEQVKAVVLRINSPGGSITASDELYHRVLELRDGSRAQKTAAKPLVVSMASVAASGGYYVSVPAAHVLAERTTITGSIGVYAALPNVAKFAKEHGVRMEVIKRGDVKASGSMFRSLTAQERQVWQDMVDHAYEQFLAVVQQGRRDRLKYQLEAVIDDEKKKIADRDEDGQIKMENGKEVMIEYVRRLADGGIYTADKAKRYGLIDSIGYLEDAVHEAAKLASLGNEDYQAITYDRPQTLLSAVLGIESSARGMQLDLANLPLAASPRLWYLTPNSELSGLLAASTPPDR